MAEAIPHLDPQTAEEVLRSANWVFDHTYELSIAGGSEVEIATLEGKKAASRYVKLMLNRIGNRAGSVLAIFKSHVPALLTALRASGFEGAFTLNIAPKGRPFEIKRGQDKGKNRDWRVSSQGKRRSKRLYQRGTADYEALLNRVKP